MGGGIEGIRFSLRANSVDELLSTWIQIGVKGLHKERWMLIFFATNRSLWMDGDSWDFN